MTKPQYRVNESAIIRYGRSGSETNCPVCLRQMAILTLAVAGCFGNALDLHQGRIERSTTTKIGESVRGQHIDVGAGFGQFSPTYPRADYAGRHCSVDPCAQENLAPVVVNTDPVAICYASALR